MLSLMSAINPAQRGATALVPPITSGLPSTRVTQPVVGSAFPVTSGTPRPTLWLGLAEAGTPALACQLGTGVKKSLMPPPVAPSLFASSFHTVSLLMELPEAPSFVPPQARTLGLEAGKSTWLSPSVTPSVEPSSPAATQTVTPIAAAAWNASSIEVMACAVQDDSGPPQLIETIEGLLVLSCTAVVIAFRKPASVLSAK